MKVFRVTLNLLQLLEFLIILIFEVLLIIHGEVEVF